LNDFYKAPPKTSFQHNFKPDTKIGTKHLDYIHFSPISKHIHQTTTTAHLILKGILQTLRCPDSFNYEFSPLLFEQHWLARTPHSQFREQLHKVCLAPLHQALHPKTDHAPQLHGLRLHDHHTYQTQTQQHQQASTSTSDSNPKVQKSSVTQPRVTLSNVQQKHTSTSAKESEIARELKEARACQEAIGREMDFREACGRTRTLRNLGGWEVPAVPALVVVKKTLAQVIASEDIVCSVLPKEKEVKTEVRRNAVVKGGINPILTQVRPDSKKTLCAADLDNIYNL
jgi:hypothetical protein